jgi:ubiquinone/menaquinone biosynthesis C-methylase UbiE
METDVKEVIRAHWNDRAAIFDSSPNHAIATTEERHEWERMFSTYIGKERRKILDIGTGTGEIALLLARAGHDVTGIDLAEKMLAEAQSKAAARGLDAKFKRGDAEHLPFADEAFEVVVNRHLLWTLPHADQALMEWKRVLIPGGKMVIVDGDWSDIADAPPQKPARKGYPQPSRDAYKDYGVADALPMQRMKRPEADLEMLQALDFASAVKWIGAGKDFFNSTPYGDGVSRKRFVIYAQKEC